MLTNFGKLLRKLRIDHVLTLGGLGELTGVSAAFISSMETGKRAVPASFLENLAGKLHLAAETNGELSRAAAQQAKKATLNLVNKSDKAKELAVAFARRFESMSDEEVRKLLGNTGES